ncbi:MAG TPA: apolipoprotein N-acyltransferase [bacterium]|nr:apolipoprotein N-acyltransferase [bacterium]
MTQQRRKLSSRDFLLAIFAAAVLTLAFPRFDVEALAFVALVPLLVAFEGLNVRQGAWLGYVFGLHWNVFLLYWLSPATTAGFICAVIYLALYQALFGLLYVAARRYGRLPALICAPVLWVAVEWLRSVGYLAFPWGLLAHTQYKWNLLIQVADVAGAWPVSLVVVAVNVLVYYILKNRRHVATWLRAGGATAALLGALCLYGALARVTPDEGQPIRVAVLQPNIDQDVKWDPAYRDQTMQVLVDLSYEAKREGATLIIWPETATPFYLFEDPFYREVVYDVAADLSVDLLTGTVERQPRPNVVRGRDHYRYNAAALITPARAVAGRYAKVRLVPFGEHIPWEADVPAVTETLFADSGDFTPGPGWEVIRPSGYELGCLICYEAVFPDISRAYARRGADFLVNITNEAWFGRTNAPYQTLSSAVFRAVENRSWYVRAANTGVTCFIDPNGRVVRKSKIYIRNQLTDDVYHRQYLTFYARHGDWFAYVVAAAAALICGWTLFSVAKQYWLSRRRRADH